MKSKKRFSSQGLATLATLATNNLELNQNRPVYHGLTLAELQGEAHPDEWHDIRDRPECLEAFALALKESRQIQAGIRPERWTGQAQCARCGEVAVAPFSDGVSLRSCRWCG